MSSEPGLPTRARAYLGLVTVAGLAAIVESLYQLVAYPIGFRWFLLAALTLISGSATVRLPSVAATISISEVFVFTSVLLFGPPAGTLTVALDALVITFWQRGRRRSVQRVLFNVAATSLSCWVGAKIFFAVSQVQPLVRNEVEIPSLLPALVLFTIVYFALNSWLITFAISLETNQRAIRIWRENFALLALNYFGGASVAVLLVSITRELDYSYLAIIVPLLLILYVTFATSMGRVEDANRHLSELNALYMSTIETLAMAIDAKDQITHGHIRRVQLYATRLAKALGIKDESQIKAVEAAALLHDMGKLAVPEYILNKPGSLTPAEFEKMKLHSTVGADILSSIAFPYPVVPIVRHHHENWDGTGYPDGLKGTDIPLGARILSVVDCFDALTSDRPYRPRLSDSDAIKILVERRGRMYDPLVVDTFVEVHREIAPSVPAVEPVAPGLTAITEAAIPSQTETHAASRFEDISSSTEEMLTLYELARGLTGQVRLPDVADVISKHLRRIVPAKVCVFFIYRSEEDELIAAHASGDSNGMFENLRIPLGQRLTGWVAANRLTILNSDPVLDLGDVVRSSKPRLKSCLGTPMLHDGKLVGVLSLYSTSRDAFSEDHRRIAEAVAKQVAATIRNAADYEERDAHLRDVVTGLPTMDRLRQLIGAENDRSVQAENVSILFIDVDGLKAINQEMGRKTGDEVLARIVESTRRMLRGADLLFRFGSDEFVALLTETDSQTASSIGKAISAAVQQITFDRGAAQTTVSVSVGIATAPSDGRSLEQLVTIARRRSSSDPASTSDSIH
jgi:diguanylate cyclase (GGDEF)-like protein/putative nucleotidyltransferase with HDIG domain